MRRITYKSFFIMSILCLCMLGGFSAQAYEAVIEQMEYSSTDHTVTVTGSVGAELVGRETTIIILRPGKTEADLISSAAKDVIAFTAQTTTDENGRFSFKAGIEGDTGEYTVVVTSRGIQSGYGEFMHIDPQDVANALNELRSVSNPEEMATKLEEYADILQLDLSEWNELDDKLKTSILNRLILSDDFNTANDFRDLFNETMASEQFNFADDENEIKSLIEKYKSEIGISELNIYKITYIQSLGNELQTAAVKAMLANGSQTYSGFEDIKASFVKHVILDSIENASNWTKINALLKGNSDVMEIDISRYENMSDTSAVDKKLVGRHFNTFKELKSAVDDAINSIGGGTGGGTGGGVSSGSGGSGSVSTGVSSGIIDITPGDVNQDPVKAPTAFADLEDVPWAAESINELAQMGVLSGKEPGLFYPDESVTRAEFAKMIVIAFGLYEDNSNTHFTDVPESAWYAPYASSAWEWGIVEGTPDGEFKGEDNITRQDMAVMIFRAWNIFDDQISNASGETIFADSDQISEYAATAVAVMADKGIINGTGENMFSPRYNATRAAAAKMIYMTICCIQEGEATNEAQ